MLSRLAVAPVICLIPCHYRHFKQNSYSPCVALTKHNAHELNGRLTKSVAVFCSCLLRLQLAEVALSLCPALQLFFFFVSLSNCLPHTFPLWLSTPRSLVDSSPVRSSLQWGEKHTCQIQVGHHTFSHPHQLLRTRHFDANKFAGGCRRAVFTQLPIDAAFFLRHGGESNSCLVSKMKQQRCLDAAVPFHRITENHSFSVAISWKFAEDELPHISLEKSKRTAGIFCFCLWSLTKSACKKKKGKLC